MPRLPPHAKEEDLHVNVSKPKRAPRRTAAEWAAIIERYQYSGMSAAAFATQEGVGAKRLRIWRSRLQRRGIATHRLASHRQRPSATPPPPTARPGTRIVPAAPTP